MSLASPLRRSRCFMARGISALSPMVLAGLTVASLEAQDERPLGAVPAQAPALGAVDGQLWALGSTFRTKFDPGSVEFTPALGARASRSYPLRMTLQSIERGGRVLHTTARVIAPEPVGDGMLVNYARGSGVTERYEVRADEIEQSFVFDARPAGRGDLVVRIRLATDMTAEPGRELTGLELSAGALGGVVIGAVTGIDANGERSAGHMNFDGRSLELVLPGEFVDAAAYPMVLDPPIGARYSPSKSYDDRLPDIAYDVTNDTYLAVFERHISAADVDIWGNLYKADYSANRAVFIGVGAGRQMRPSVANVNLRNRFLVAWQDNAAGNWDIKVRSVDAANAALSSVVTIASGSAQQTHPDVGGESRLVDDEAIVVWDDSALGIRAAQVNLPSAVTGTPTRFSPITVIGGANQLKNTPAICKGCGTNGRTAIAWQDDPTFLSVAIWDMNLQRLSANCGLSSRTNAVSQPDVAGDGTNFMLVYERREGGTTSRRDIYGAVVNAPTNSANCTVIRDAGPIFNEPGVEELLPTTSFLGSRFVVAASRAKVTGFQVQYADTLPTSVDLCGPIRRFTPDGRNQLDIAIVSKREAGDLTSNRGLVVYRENVFGSSRNIIWAQRYAATRDGEFRPSAAGAGFGRVVARVGDVDGDGHDDLGIGHPGRSNNLGGFRIISGRTHRTILDRPSATTGLRMGTALAGGDFNDDGKSDVLVGSPGSPRSGVQVLYGGSLFFANLVFATNSQSGVVAGHHVATGHFDNTRGADAVYTQGAVNGAVNQLVAWSVFPNRQRRLWTATLPAAIRCIATIGDINGDGYDDIAVGMPTWGGNRSGRCEIRSGRNGARLYAAGGGPAGQEFGYAVAAIGDVDRDGWPEIAVGKPGSDPGFVDIWDPQSGRFLSAGRGLRAGARFGAVLSSIGDVDKDGVPDLLVAGEPSSGTNLVEIRSGRRLDDQLTSFTGGSRAFGSSIAGLESNGDDKPDVAIGEPTATGGVARLHDDTVRSRPPAFTTYGSGCPSRGRIPRISGSTGTVPERMYGARGRIGGRYSIHLANARANSPAILRLGATRAFLPLDFLGLPGCFNLPGTILVDIPFRTNAMGAARLTSALDNNLSWVGATFRYQWWVLDPAANAFGFSGSDGAEFRIGAGL